MRGAAPVLPLLGPLIAGLLSIFNFSLTDITKQVWDSEYDYIIVGSGSAGSVVAARLSEDPNVKVLLLEAGGGDGFLTEVPFAAPLLQKTEIDWKYRTVVQNNSCRGFKEHRSAWPRGKLLGGSSSINYMLYSRGNKRDYDLWAQEGCQGWSWQDVFPYFLKMEDQRDPAYLTSGYHATGGPLTIESLDVQSPLSRAFLESGQHLGYELGDFNGPRQSWYYPQGTLREGKRCSVVKAYLQPASNRTNLDIVSHALVVKILFQKGNSKVSTGQPQARGVQFRRKLATHEVRARKEVILSAGTINSPQLLMLSGIGPGEHLRQVGVPLVADLPVGNNLQDHIWTPLSFEANKHTSFRPDNIVTPLNLVNLLAFNKGPLTSLGGIEAFGYVQTSFVNTTLDWPDFELSMCPLTPATGGPIFPRIQDLTDEFNEKFLLPYLGKDTMSIFPILMRPKSRGQIRLASSDPAQDPLIDPQYYSHPDDIKSMVEALKICLQVAKATPLKRFGVKPFVSVVPGCERYPLYSSDYLECFARSYTASLWHPVGTCRMGALDDNRTVVDPELRVKGVGRLRVVDASVMPNIITGHTNVPSIMIAEKAADLIRSSASDV